MRSKKIFCQKYRFFLLFFQNRKSYYFGGKYPYFAIMNRIMTPLSLHLQKFSVLWSRKVSDCPGEVHFSPFSCFLAVPNCTFVEGVKSYFDLFFFEKNSLKSRDTAIWLIGS